MQDNRYWENDRVQYVEGIGLSKHTARITGHGWIEHDERVVELTWPWHSPLPPEETVYFGRPVSRKELEDSWKPWRIRPVHTKRRRLADSLRRVS